MLFAEFFTNLTSPKTCYVFGIGLVLFMTDMLVVVYNVVVQV